MQSKSSNIARWLVKCLLISLVHFSSWTYGVAEDISNQIAWFEMFLRRNNVIILFVISLVVQNISFPNVLHYLERWSLHPKEYARYAIVSWWKFYTFRLQYHLEQLRISLWRQKLIRFWLGSFFFVCMTWIFPPFDFD